MLGTLQALCMYQIIESSQHSYERYYCCPRLTFGKIGAENT